MSVKDNAGLRRGVHIARWHGEYLGVVLVDCPGCGRCAEVRPIKTGDEDTTCSGRHFSYRRMVCRHCATVRDEPRLGGSNPTMGLPLRLQAQTRHGTLVFYNLDHLDYVRAYLADDIRTETFVDSGIRNGSIISRLPTWAKRAGARDEVVAALDKARQLAD